MGWVGLVGDADLLAGEERAQPRRRPGVGGVAEEDFDLHVAGPAAVGCGLPEQGVDHR